MSVRRSRLDAQTPSVLPSHTPPVQPQAVLRPADPHSRPSPIPPAQPPYLSPVREAYSDDGIWGRVDAVTDEFNYGAYCMML